MAVKLPKTIGTSIDHLFRMRAQRLAVEKTVKEMKSSEEEMKLHILQLLKKSKLEKAAGRIATASRTEVTVAQVDDWPAFVTWCVDQDATDCIQRRANSKPLLEREDDGVKLPASVHIERIAGLSLTKSKS